jgi:hypothetical protein
VNALAKDEVGKYLNTHFVAAFQKVGTFQKVGEAKQGGNVASYFCTADGRVLHVVAGPVDGPTLLKEARWVVENWKLAQLDVKTTPQLKAFFAKAHARRLATEHNLDLKKILPEIRKDSRSITPDTLYQQPWFRNLNAQGRVHLILAAFPLVKIEQIYRVIFEKVLNEKISTSPVAMK